MSDYSLFSKDAKVYSYVTLGSGVKYKVDLRITIEPDEPVSYVPIEQQIKMDIAKATHKVLKAIEDDGIDIG